MTHISRNCRGGITDWTYTRQKDIATYDDNSLDKYYHLAMFALYEQTIFDFEHIRAMTILLYITGLSAFMWFFYAV